MSRHSIPDVGRQAEVDRWLRKLHVANGHLASADMVQAIKDAGGFDALLRLADPFVCPQCQIERRVANRKHSSLPLHTRHFNAIVVLDLGVANLDRPSEDQKELLLLGMIDTWSMFSLVFVLVDASTESVTAAAQRGWIAPFGSPHRVFHDSAAALRGAQ